MNLLDFGTYLRGLRIRLGKPLRQFCAEHKFETILYSKLERGIAPIPDKYWLEKYAHALKLKKDSPEWLDFFNRVAACSTVTIHVKKTKEEVCMKPLVVDTKPKENQEDWLLAEVKN